MKTVYKYNPTTLEYIGSAKISMIAGYDGYLMPRFSTEITPPTFDSSTQLCKYAIDFQSWQVEDIPKRTVYNSETGEPLEILETEETPLWYQDTQPVPKTNDELFAKEMASINDEYDRNMDLLVKKHAVAIARDGAQETEKVASARAEIQQLDIQYSDVQNALIAKYYGES